MSPHPSFLACHLARVLSLSGEVILVTAALSCAGQSAPWLGAGGALLCRPGARARHWPRLTGLAD